MAEFAHNNSLHGTLGDIPFHVLYGFHPSLEVEDDSLEGEVPTARERMKHIHKLKLAMEQRWRSAVAAQAKYYNKTHQSRLYNIGKLVLSSTRNLKVRQPNRKLSHKFLGPFRIIELVGKRAYRLALPTKYQIDDVFHVSLLEPYKGTRNTGDTLPGPEIIDDETQWEVEEILDHKTERGALKYKVKWAGYGAEYNQWVAEEDMGNPVELVRWYEHNATKRGKRKRD